jgi:hypothetical protein
MKLALAKSARIGGRDLGQESSLMLLAIGKTTSSIRISG